MFQKKILYLFSSFLLLISTNSSSQDLIGFSGIYGNHIIFEDDTFFHDFMYGFDINYSQDIREKEWAKSFIANQLIFNFNYLNLSNLHGFYSEKLSTQPRYIAAGLGHQFGLSSGLNIPLLTFPNWSINLLPEIGVSYITRTYFTNPSENNLFVGSHLNFLFRNEINTVVLLNQKYSLKSSIRYMHFSNSGWTVPNIGINSLQFTFGILKKIR